MHNMTTNMVVNMITNVGLNVTTNVGFNMIANMGINTETNVGRNMAPSVRPISFESPGFPEFHENLGFPGHPNVMVPSTHCETIRHVCNLCASHKRSV